MGKVAEYHRVTVPMMSFVHDGRSFGPDHVWTNDELLAVTPEILVRYIKIKVYDCENAQPDIDPPLHHRASTILFWKKAWSYFMLNQITPWNEIARVGNPTRSTAVNKIIKAMKKMEAARLGRPSQARRAFRPIEFEQIIEILSAHGDEVGIWMAAYLAFQFSMIARIDDTAKFRAPDLKPLEEFPFYGVTAKLCWSKNILDARDPPTQVLFGAEDWRYCVPSLLGSWLELHFLLNPEANEFLFGAFGLSDPIAIKRSAGYHLRKIFKDDEFVTELLSELGSHSNRKHGVTTARKSGCSKDDVDFRGRWKNSRRQQDTYADTTIPFVDAKVASALCKGGPVAHVVKEASGITDQWILDYVVPNMRGGLFCPDPKNAPEVLAVAVPVQVCIVLGRALLFKIFDSSLGDKQVGGVAPQTRARVMDAYACLGGRNTLSQGENPVKKIPLGVVGVDSELFIDELLHDDGAGGTGGDNMRVRAGMERQEVRLLSSQVLHLRQELRNATCEHDRRYLLLRHELSRINKNVSRIAAAPARRQVGNVQQLDGAEQTGGESVPGATQVRTEPAVVGLMSRPSTLHDLWTEWILGTGGRRPASSLNANERGSVKSVYSFRKPFWDKVDEMVRVGMSAQVACDEIHRAYGQQTSITDILRNMRQDSKSGNWPAALRTAHL
jgi:hypothetical protein